MIDQHKITVWTNPIVDEADRPKRSATEMKQVFDANSNQLKTSLNGLIDELVSSVGANSVGSAAIAGISGTTVHEQIVALMASKVASLAIKALRIGTDEYLEYTLDGITWVKAPTWGDVTVEPGGDAKNLTVTFAQGEYQNIASGESMAIILGKLMAWFNTLSSHAGQHASNGTDPITPASIGAATATTTMATLTVAGWTGTEAPYQQAANVTGVSEINNVIVSPAPTAFDAWGEAKVRCTAQGDGTLTFVCEAVPDVDLTANILIVG